LRSAVRTGTTGRPSTGKGMHYLAAHEKIIPDRNPVRLPAFRKPRRRSKAFGLLDACILTTRW
jgi:hypothetical protein